MDEISIKLRTLEVESEALTKRVVLYKGFFGKLTCIKRWLFGLFSGNMVTFKTWLDQKMTYVIDFDVDINDHQGFEVNGDVERSLEELLKTEMEKVESNG